MIPTRADYYRRRANEHRMLASRAEGADQRAMHDVLVDAYQALARKARLRRAVRVRT